MQVGTEVWIKNAHLDLFNNEPWLPSTIKSNTVGPEHEAVVVVAATTKGREDITFNIPAGQFELPDLKYRNSSKHQQNTANLNRLCFLNEPELITTLRARYYKNILSTYVGQVLVHINPLRAGVNIEEGGGAGAEGDQILENFAQDVKNRTTMAPEMWDAALAHMKAKGRRPSLENLHVGSGDASKGGVLTALMQAQPNGNKKSTWLGHSIIINGESGSGKTETARAILKSLLKPSLASENAGLTVQQTQQQDALMARLGHATALLDALGNARLHRNANSSRYGKYLELGFDRSLTLAGAYIRTYLLESVLVCKQSAEESNFHVFYMLVKGTKATERVKWGLTGDCEAYTYLAGNDTVTSTVAGTGVTATADVEAVPTEDQEKYMREFTALKESLHALGVSSEETHQLFSVIAAILHLGQVRFSTITDVSGDSSVVRGADRGPLELAAKLLGVSLDQLETALVRKKSLVIRGEVILKALTATQAAATRDSIVRNIYKRVFEWALGRINASLQPTPSTTGNTSDAGSSGSGSTSVGPMPAVASCVGILDIFGFENVGVNSFEQLCINYSSEVLHKHFCESVFLQEIVEYQQQGVRYDSIAYRRSDPLIKLLGTEIMSMLDEQVRQPNATDTQFLIKLNKKFGIHSPLALASVTATANGHNPLLVRLGETDFEDGVFRVTHYACEVTYHVSGFLEKHFDEVPAAVERMLQTSSSAVLNLGLPASSLGRTSSFSPPSSPTNKGLQPTGLSSNHNASFSTNTVRRAQNVNLGAYFKAQLALLIEQLKMTVPHFVRCIKASDKALASNARRGSAAGANNSNTANSISSVLANPLLNKGKRPSHVATAAPVPANYVGLNTAFNPFRVAEQLRSAGLIDAIQLTRQHYKVKAPMLDFYQRYRSVITPDHPMVGHLSRFLKAEHSPEQARESCQVLMEALQSSAALTKAMDAGVLSHSTSNANIKSTLHWQLGRSPVYLTASDHTLLEHARFAVLEVAGEVLARRINVYNKRWTFLRAVRAARLLQRVARGKLARKEAHQRRKFIHAVISLQRRYRNQVYVNETLVKLRKLVKALLTVQKCARRFCARRMVLRLKLARERYLATSGNLLIAKELRLARRRGDMEVVREFIPAVESHMAEYRAQEALLLGEINNMIHGTKVTADNGVVRFEVKETRRVLQEWAHSVPSITLQGLLRKLAGKVNFGYKLLRPAQLIPMVQTGLFFAFYSPQYRKKLCVKRAEKNVTLTHPVFGGVEKVQKLIEEVLRVAFTERKNALTLIDSIKKELVRNIRKHGPEFSRSRATPYYTEIQKHKEFISVTDSIMRFGLVLYRYYQSFVSMVVSEYGEKSTYRRNFADDEVYLLTLQQMIETANEPLHFLEQFLQMSNAEPSTDLVADFPLKLTDSAIIASHHSPNNTNNAAMQKMQVHNGVYYRYMPYAPGLDFAVNSFQQFLSPHSISPARLLKLSGMSSDNYGQCTYYHASMGFSDKTLSDVFSSPVLVEKLHFTSTSAAIITSLLTGAGDCRPDNFMVKYVYEQSPYGTAGEVERVELLGVSTDKVYQNTAFQYARIAETFSTAKPPNAMEILTLREQGISEVGVGFNCLFFLPQMDEPVDPEIGHFFRSTPTVPEEVVCSWLKYLFQQNKRFESLKISGGFTAQDFDALHLPIQLPLGSAIRLLQRLQELREHLHTVDAKKLTHHALLSIWYPELAAFYKEWRMSSNKNHITDADLDLVPTATAADVSMLPLDYSNPTDRSIQAELAASGHTGQGISQKSKRAFFYALTPYHKLYQEAVAKVEKEVTTLLSAKVKAAALAAGHTLNADGTIDIDKDQESRISDTDQQETERDGEREGSEYLDENEERNEQDTFDEAHSSAPNSHSNRRPRSSPKHSNHSDQGTPTRKARPMSVEQGFHNIYLDEGSDTEENEEYYYEDAPTGLRHLHTDKQNNRNSHKRPTSKNLNNQRQRRDEKSLSFYKHKLAQVQAQNNTSGFLSPLVTHDLYPQPGQEKTSLTPTANGDPRYKSLRLDSLYGDKDTNVEGLEFSEAEQTVMYLRSGDPTAPTALLSPVVTQGSNPMAGQPKKINVFPVSEEIEGANPMQQRRSLGMNEEQKEEEDGWRVEDAASDDISDDSGTESESDEEEHGVDESAAVLSPIADVALQFLISLDFRRFDADASRRICRIIGDTMSFLETLWLRYITEDQLRYMFEGYFEQKRHHRVASALTSTSATGASGVLGSANKTHTEIYATKEIKLIGISAELFKRLQRTSTVNRLRRVLGIQVSLVVIDAEDDTFVDVLSQDHSNSSVSSVMGADSPLPSVVTPGVFQSAVGLGSDSPSVSAASVGGASSVTKFSQSSSRTPGRATIPDPESDEEEGPQDLESRLDRAVDFPERYQELKRRTKLALISYTNMVGTVPPERISHNSTIVREVVRLSATLKGAQSLSVTLANQFGLIFLDFPGFARIGKELADRGVFNQTNRIIHRLLTHAQIERYLDVIYSILEQTPSVLLLKDRSDNFLPCDRVKALPDSRPFKYALLARFINAIPLIDAEYAATHSAGVVTPTAKKNAPAGSGTSTPTSPDAPRLTGDEAFLSLYAGDEELIVRALHFNLATTPEEVKDKVFDLHKKDPSTHENVFHKCIACYTEEPFIYNSAIETFRVALRVLKERCIGSEFTQLQAEQLLYVVTNTAGLTPWELAAKHSARPMLELMALDWTKSEAAPPAAVAMSPTRRKPTTGVSQATSSSNSNRNSGRGGFGLSVDMEMEGLDEEGSEGDFEGEVEERTPNTFSTNFNASQRSVLSIGLVDVENA